MPPLRVRLVLAIVAALAVGSIWWLVPRGAAGDPQPGPQPSQEARALAILRAWDDARAAAYASGDLVALKALYIPGSAVGRRDQRVLRDYRARGLRVEGMQTQILELRILHTSEDRLELAVTDRLAGAVAVGESGRWRLPRDVASAQRVVLVRARGQWLVASVDVVESQSPSAVASTSATVGSENR
ncbi:MAG: hypothetical protein V9F00_12020 [Nocardioides sp.]